MTMGGDKPDSRFRFIEFWAEDPSIELGWCKDYKAYYARRKDGLMGLGETKEDARACLYSYEEEQSDYEASLADD